MSLKLVIAFFTSVFWAHSTFANIDFSNNCGNGKDYIFSFVGDLIMHSPLQKKAADKKDFKSLWSDVIPYFQLAHFSYANLETTVAEGISVNANKEKNDPGHVYDKDIYTTYPKFNTHPTLIKNLVESDIDVVSTANNHSLDRGVLGVDKTIDTLNQFNLQYTGTRKKGDDKSPWYTITNKQGLSVAWLSCTEMTNGLVDTYKQVLNCHQDKANIHNLIKNLSENNDVVIITPHWGDEGHDQHNQNQESLAEAWLDQGATLIIGSHPHVIQPMRKYITADQRETFIMYSLGNFTTFHYDTKQKSSLVLFVSLEKEPNGEVRINGIRYLPLFMRNRTGWYMDVEVHPLFSTNTYSGNGYEDVTQAADHIYSMLGYENAIQEEASSQIKFNHCHNNYN